jgi:hypothetical protein
MGAHFLAKCAILYIGEVKGVSIVKRCLALFIVALIFPAVPAFPDYVTCYRAKDAYVRSDIPDENFDNNFLYHGRKSSGIEYLCFLQFDLSPIPEFAEIEEAYLEYHIATFGGESSGDTYFSMLNEEWSECGVTFNEYPEVIGGVTVGVEWSRQEWVKTNCTEFVRRWYEGEAENYGIVGMVAGGEEDCWYRIYSREFGDEGTNPRMVVKVRKTNIEDEDSGDEREGELILDEVVEVIADAEYSD